MNRFLLLICFLCVLKSTVWSQCEERYMESRYDNFILHKDIYFGSNITVDGDTSTNDACVLMATGKSREASVEDTGGDAYAAFSSAVTDVCTVLAQTIVRDAEGATKRAKEVEERTKKMGDAVSWWASANAHKDNSAGDDIEKYAAEEI